MRPDNMPRPHAPEHSEVDIVDALRASHDDHVQQAAAAEIERLRAEVAARTESGQIACLADIREAVGDPTGKLMQDELVALVRELAELRRRVERAPVARPLELQCSGFDDPDRDRLDAIVKSGKRVRLLPEEVNDGQE
jgi:hypothetical protein